ncbi:MAG: voltage-gated potassium channel [Salibacteraceae bacterium]|jgi:voltage-gated potassium channel
MIHIIKKTIRKFDHILLLVGLVFLLAAPIWEQVIGSGFLWSDIMILISLVAGVSVTHSHKVGELDYQQYMGFMVIVLTCLNSFIGFGVLLETITRSSQVVFFLLLSVTVSKLIIKSRSVDSEVVVNSISGYLLLGLSWSIIIGIWNSAYPGSFNFVFKGQDAFFDSMYYVFVTMTTLGYGDMLPITMAGKAFSMLISVTGAFYTTIVLGMIVGKYISNQTLNNLK